MPATLMTPPVPVLGRDAWKVKARAGEPGPALLRKGFVGAVERMPTDAAGAGDPTRQIRFVISSAAPDRDGDTIAVDGWEIDNYLKNPVVLWAHDYGCLPIAKAVSLSVLGGALVAVDEFPEADLHPMGDLVFRLLLAGYLRAVSVGFLPQKWTFNETTDGIDFLAQELLEHSVVPVPSNPEALSEARSVGIDIAPLTGWAERVLDEAGAGPGVWLPRASVQRALKVATGERWLMLAPGAAVPDGVQTDAVDELHAVTTLTVDGESLDAAPVERGAATLILEPGVTAIKSGRVLSAANKDKLTQAMGHIKDVLDSCGDDDEGDDAPGHAEEPVEAAKAGPAPAEAALTGPDAPPARGADDILITLPDEPATAAGLEFDLSAADVKALVRDAVREALTAVTGRLP